MEKPTNNFKLIILATVIAIIVVTLKTSTKSNQVIPDHKARSTNTITKKETTFEKENTNFNRVKTLPFSWTQLDTSTLNTLENGLIQANCPKETIKDIISALDRNMYREDLAKQAENIDFWNYISEKAKANKQ